jgi:hypothetical protein
MNWAAVAFALAILGPGDPAASPPSFEREVAAVVGSAVNPAGLMARVEVRWRRPLSRSSSPLLSDAHLTFGISPEVSPSYARAGAWTELAPLSILVVRAGVEPAQYFGTFSSLISFNDPSQPFDRDTMRARRSEAKPGNAVRVYARPSLRLKAKRLGGQVTGEVERWWCTANGPYFHEPGRNTLVAVRGGTVRALSAAALYDLSRRVGVGAAYDLVDVPGARRNRAERLAALVTWTPRAPLPLVGRPALTAMAGTYLRDPNREGEAFAALGIGLAVGKR